MRQNSLLLSPLLCLLALLFSSCKHKPLVYGGSADVTVRFDWTRCPDAAPSLMRLVAYYPSTQPVEVPMIGRDGESLSLPAGNYQFVGYNSDTEDLYTRGDSYETFEIGARTTELYVFSPMFAQRRSQQIPRAPETDNQPVIFEPEQLWTSAKGDVMLIADVNNVVTMPMQEATCEYSFTIRNVENIEHISELAATISGMSGSWFPAFGKASSTECIIPFVLYSDGVSTLSGKVRTFGHCPHYGVDGDDQHARHQLVVYAQLQDGSKYYYTFDVTESMHDADHQWSGDGDDGTGTEIPIELSDVPFPQPMYNGTGLHPSVDQWQEVNIDMNM